VKLEEKGLTGLQRSKFPRPAGLPEVHFVGMQPTYEVKPVLIRDPHPDFNFVPPFMGWQKDNRSVESSGARVNPSQPRAGRRSVSDFDVGGAGLPVLRMHRETIASPHDVPTDRGCRVLQL
jgi:hypothetical protein